MKFFIFFILTCNILNSAFAFDCTKAKSKTEHAICNSKVLLGLDKDLNQTYKDRLSQTKDSDEIKKLKSIQLSWIHENENACQGNEACLTKRYQDQIQVLGSPKPDSGVIIYKTISIEQSTPYDKKVSYPEFSGSDPAVAFLNDWVKKIVKDGTNCDVPGESPEQARNKQMYFTVEILKVSPQVAAFSWNSSTMCGSPSIVDSQSSALIDLKNKKEFDLWKELSEKGRQLIIKKTSEIDAGEDCTQLFSEKNLKGRSFDFSFEPKTNSFTVSPALNHFEAATCANSISIDSKQMKAIFSDKPDILAALKDLN